MSNNLQLKRGLQSALPIGLSGELLFTTDTKRLYLSDGSANNLLQGSDSIFTTGSIPFSNSSGKLTTDSSNFYWDDTNNRLGIGTATPTTTFQVLGTTTTQNIAAQTNATYDIGLLATKFRDGWFSRNLNCGSIWANNLAIAGTNLTLYNAAVSVIGTLFGSGNLLLSTGTQTDAGFKLDVNGTARVSGLMRSTDVFVVGGAATTNTANARFWSSGGQAPTSGLFRGLYTDISFIPSSGSAEWYGIDFRPTINQTGGANGITRGLYIAPTLTAAADFRAIEVANGITILGASTTAKASLRIPSGTAPTSPTNGDIWFDGTDLKMRIGGVTKTFTLI